MVDSSQSESDARRAAAQEVAAQVLARGGSYADAAGAAGVDPRTIGRWNSGGSAFAVRVADLRAEWVGQTAGKLTGLGDLAVSVLAQSLQSNDSAERLRAANLTLTWSTRCRREADIERRLQVVEQKQGIRPADEAENDGDELLAPAADDAGPATSVTPSISTPPVTQPAVTATATDTVAPGTASGATAARAAEVMDTGTSVGGESTVQEPPAS